MQFLGFESGRKAIRDLVEFDPTQVEDICTILLSELVANGFSRRQFSGDLRQRRLQARDAEYRRAIPVLLDTVEAGSGHRWEKARDLADEVKRLYAELFPSELSLNAHTCQNSGSVSSADELVAARHRRSSNRNGRPISKPFPGFRQRPAISGNLVLYAVGNAGAGTQYSSGRQRTAVPRLGCK